MLMRAMQLNKNYSIVYEVISKLEGILATGIMLFFKSSWLYFPSFYFRKQTRLFYWIIIIFLTYVLIIKLECSKIKKNIKIIFS